MGKDGKLKVAALADVHYGRSPQHRLPELFEAMSKAADVIVIAGDLTDHGLPEEATLLVEDLRSAASVPVVAVFGNHDYESGHEAELCEILQAGGIRILDGGYAVIGNVGFAGVCGYGGGFDRYAVNAFGEALTKHFVQRTVEETFKLENALSQVPAERKVAVLHYAPIRATVHGEPPEILPFLGSTRLEAPLDHYGVKVAFHGHAHAGTHCGKTTGGVPVYNVALPVLRRLHEDDHSPPFLLYKV